MPEQVLVVTRTNDRFREYLRLLFNPSAASMLLLTILHYRRANDGIALLMDFLTKTGIPGDTGVAYLWL